jgi:hypothetical protein
MVIEWLRSLPYWVLYIAAGACLICMCASILFGRNKDDGWRQSMIDSSSTCNDLSKRGKNA